MVAGDDKEEMGILLRLYASLQNRRFDQALRKRDADALSAFAGESGLRARPRQALAAARLLIEQGRPVAAAARLITIPTPNLSHLPMAMCPPRLILAARPGRMLVPDRPDGPI